MRSDLPPDVTPETHPDHHTVGRDFLAWSIKHGRSARFYCRSHDAAGYNMLNRADPLDDRNVSERAIGRTYHEVMVDDHGEFCNGARVRIDREGRDIA